MDLALESCETFMVKDIESSLEKVCPPCPTDVSDTSSLSVKDVPNQRSETVKKEDIESSLEKECLSCPTDVSDTSSLSVKYVPNQRSETLKEEAIESSLEEICPCFTDVPKISSLSVNEIPKQTQVIDQGSAKYNPRAACGPHIFSRRPDTFYNEILLGEVCPCPTDVLNISGLNVNKVSDPWKVPDHQISSSSSPSQLHISGGGFYTKEEIAVLRATSLVNGREYVPFMPVDLKERFAYTLPFCDKDGILSLRPELKGVRWARPENISSKPVVIETLDCLRIKQTAIKDCSFIASLIVSALYEQRFKKKILTSIIYPQNEAGEPVYNPYGKYMIKMHFNGILRKIIIDDLLPLGSDGELLCSSSTNKNEFWISLLEKAYLKVRGGYNLPRSTPDFDIHALTGWIPESVNLCRTIFSLDKTLKFLVEYHNAGHVLLVVGTSNFSAEVGDRVGLADHHCYAILDVKEFLGKRLFLLKNPWGQKRWKGSYSANDMDIWTPQLKEALCYDPQDAQMFDNGVFWIDEESLFQYFSRLYLGWNPELFQYTYCLHQSWRPGAGRSAEKDYVGENPQFCLDVISSGIIWVLLIRHITELEDPATQNNFISVEVFKTDGQKIYFNNDPNPEFEVISTNRPTFVCKILNSQEGSTKYTLVIYQRGTNATFYYTLRVYSTCPFNLSKIETVFKYKQKVRNRKWAKYFCGVSANITARFPRYLIYQVILQGSSDDNNMLIDLKGHKEFYVCFEVVAVSVNDSNSPHYFERKLFGKRARPHFAMLEIRHVPSGTYSIIVYDFYANRKFPYSLTIQATCPIKVSREKCNILLLL